MKGERAPSLRGPLRPGELAEVAVLGDLALALEVLGWFLPLGGIFEALAVLPFAVLASRHRLRAGVMAAASAAAVSFLVGGVGIVIETALAAVVGISVGTTYRRHWSPVVSLGATLALAGVPIAALTDFIDWLSPGFRRLTFAQVRIIWRDIRHVLDALGEQSAAAKGGHDLNVALAHWWATVPAIELATVLLVALFCLRMRPFLAELAKAAMPPHTGTVAERRHGGELVAPVPVRLEKVSFSYAEKGELALDGVSLDLGPGRLAAIVGRNGSGKSTLVSVLAGRLQPTSGRVERKGRAGYGERGGTAMIFQRPESQVLGVRVRDDLFWGLGPNERPEPSHLLSMVGLEGKEEDETSSLSGGQLQRLAIASALGRGPRLLISDESTAMIDAEGRQEVVGLLRRLSDEGLAVVHVTHRRSETDRADEVVELRGGKVVEASSEPAMARPAVARARGPVAWGPPLVSLRSVSYAYARGTPWEKQALEGIDLEIASGEGLVVTGANGSGKTTLAWILGGLMAPSSGSALISGVPLYAAPERVGVSFQHARLQLLKPTVLADVATGSDTERARRALLEVGLDPDEIGGRRVDDLSGGEQRRVALAGLIVRRPELLVLDEPYAGLDDEARYYLAEVLVSLRRERLVTTVVVSHDLDHAELLGDRLVYLEKGRSLGEELAG